LDAKLKKNVAMHDEATYDTVWYLQRVSGV
jgi:hypothetical protein